MSEIVIKALSPSLIEDYLRFFEGSALSTQPWGARCYCQYYHTPTVFEWSMCTPAQNRIAMQARIAVAEMEGFLAYSGARLIGWLNAQPRHKLPHCFARLGIYALHSKWPVHEIATALCFVIVEQAPHQATAQALLRFACANFAARGIRLIEAFPSKTEPSETEHDRGSLSLFLDEGFEVAREEEGMWIMRKSLSINDAP